jgi:anti-anti-sigma factor
MEQLEIVRGQGTAGSATILWLKGPLTLTTLFAFKDILQDLGDRDLVIDVSQTPYIDSAGLGSILGRWAHSQRSGHKFALTGVSPRIGVLLEITKVKNILPTFQTPEDAERNFTGKTATA